VPYPATRGGCAERVERQEHKSHGNIKGSIALSASDLNLFGRYKVVVLNRCEETRHALLHHSTIVNQTTVSLVAGKTLVLGICIANGEVFRELRVLDEMLPVCGVL
jgi:hypothetical protein